MVISCVRHEQTMVVAFELHDPAVDVLEDGDGIDYSDKFTYRLPFTSFEEAFNYCLKMAQQNHFNIVKSSYHPGDDHTLSYNYIRCDRGGTRNVKMTSANSGSKKNTTTKRCRCPFLIKVTKGSEGNWTILPVRGHHNHKLENYLDGHRRMTAFSDEQKKFLKEQRDSQVKPAKVRLGFGIKYPNQPMPVMKQIYNHNARLSKEERGGRNRAQHMLYLASYHMYIQHIIRDDETGNRLTHIFIAHPDALKMLHAWPYVVLIDSTYKTNQYGAILVEIIGVTPVGKIFLIAYALVLKEKTENYMWVLERLKAMMNDNVVPNVIVTDHEEGLIAAIPKIFPNSHHLLCTFHIYNAVETKATNLYNGDFGQMLTYGRWCKVIEANDEQSCFREWEELKTKFSNRPSLIRYLEDTWMTDHVTKFGKCYSNKVYHFGNTATSRVELAHATLKDWFGSSTLALDSMWKRAHAMIEGQHCEIRKSLEASLSRQVVSHVNYGTLFSLLRGRVSINAIISMQNEFYRGEKLGIGLYERGGCVIRSTHGLLCACRLHTLFVQKGKVHVDDLHMFWSTLVYTESAHRRSTDNDVLEDLFEQIRRAHPSMRRVGGALLELGFTVVNLNEFRYARFIPVPVEERFGGFYDPRGDGHCGFRVISHALRGDENHWKQMRYALSNEIKDPIYLNIYGDGYDFDKRRINWVSDSGCGDDHWMIGYDLFGFATMYNWTICLLSSQINNGVRNGYGSSTYLPLRVAPGVAQPYGILWVLHTGRHFMRIRVNGDAPMPQINPLWRGCSDESVHDWDQMYARQTTSYERYFQGE
ncbi:putative protein FAR1-RELATED SEQUENCE 10 [Silene latifolia]|uniref:putative protein FAR1-RELATED SEQUENCE 10 n=1 Tax=Silene latifolia TaxID=37657 RepID=UPI003D77011E